MVLIDHLAALLHPGTSLWGLHDSGTTLIKKIEFSSYIRKFSVEQLQSHI
jgi:hypothetical protein